MNAEYKAKWVEALRSGKYKQGHFALRPGEDKYCCLGVACDLFGEGEWGLSPLDSGDSSFVYVTGQLLEDESLPWEVSTKLGLSPITQQTLTTLNDHDGFNFDEIADYIEENL